MKKNLIRLGLSLGVIFLLTGCGEKVIIENGEVGKQITTSGLEKNIRKAGALKMDSCAFGTACPKLVRLSISENSKTIPGKFFINKSQLEMQLDLEIQYAVKKDNDSINAVFDRVKGIADEKNSRQLFIPEEKIYTTFIKPILRDTVRTALNNYSIEEIMENLGKVRLFVEQTVKRKLNKSPVRIITLSFGKVGYPASILKAKEDFAKIELDKATKMKSMAAELQIMTKKLELDKKRAEMALEVNQIISKKMNDNLKSYMLIEAINKSAESGTPWAITNSMIFRDKKKGK